MSVLKEKDLPKGICLKCPLDVIIIQLLVIFRKGVRCFPSSVFEVVTRIQINN